MAGHAQGQTQRNVQANTQSNTTRPSMLTQTSRIVPQRKIRAMIQAERAIPTRQEFDLAIEHYGAAMWTQGKWQDRSARGEAWQEILDARADAEQEIAALLDCMPWGDVRLVLAALEWCADGWGSEYGVTGSPTTESVAGALGAPGLHDEEFAAYLRLKDALTVAEGAGE